MKRSVLAVAVTIMALLSACATLPPKERLAEAAQSDQGPRVGEVSGRTAVVHTDGLVGFDTRLSRTSHGVRGVLFGRTVDVQIASDGMVGHVNAIPTRVNVVQGEALKLVGTLEGRPVDLTVTDTTWTGRLAGCDVELQRVEHGFLGNSSCDPMAEPAALILFPRELEDAPIAEKLLYIGLSVRTGERVGAATDGIARLQAHENRLSMSERAWIRRARPPR